MNFHRHYALRGFFGGSDEEPSVTIRNQDKTFIVNGTYTAGEEYTGFGTVVVDVPSSEKSYPSAEQASF